ncbi:EF hand family protein [Cryptosporidium muris RN66]|uniref:EF hand family protein n=1 Tax=Cryptosporidium muris (strain RN66) TaxID=441375 RepID=B6AIU6_CRYMR|nr:EF hand family protein [Cryptosporidium muris RN66]EEA08137.1 EF hand family protein [Cryptosporidium muris RN66]|eukprot:XP_002142486.1 EF hand family protein [Cryptosporidium muris RN66]
MVDPEPVHHNKGDNLRNDKAYHLNRSIEMMNKYDDEFLRSITSRPTKYHILDQVDADDCIITYYHHIISNEFLDKAKEIASDQDFKLNKRENSSLNSKELLMIGEQYDEKDGEYEDSIMSEEISISSSEYDKFTDKKRLHEKNNYGVLNLPNSDFLVVKRLPVSFGIPIIPVQKLNSRPIFYVWFIFIISIVYGFVHFLNYYIINEVIPLHSVPANFTGYLNIDIPAMKTSYTSSTLLRPNNSKKQGNYSKNKENSSIRDRIFWLFSNKENKITPTEFMKPMNISLDIKHCHVQFLESPNNLSYLKIRSWGIFSHSFIYNSINGRYRVPANRLKEFEYACSFNILFWILKRYIFPWTLSDHADLKKLSLSDYRKFCDRSPRSWNFTSETDLNIKLHQFNNAEYFQCSINFFVSNNFLFDNIHIRFVPSSSYMHVSSNTPLYVKSSLHLEALHAVFNFKEIYSPNITTTISDGWVSFDISTPKNGIENKFIFIESRGAPVYINSKVPINLSMPTRIANMAQLRANNIKVRIEKYHGLYNTQFYGKFKCLVAHLTPSQYSGISLLSKNFLNINIEGNNPPSYITVHNLNADDPLKIWAGKEQWKDPHLLSFSKLRFDNFAKWLQEDLAGPWVLYINILGNDEYPKGTWKAVSSKAFIKNSFGLILLSGGLLKPRSYSLYIHVLGLQCLVPIVNSDLEDLDVITIDNEYTNRISNLDSIGYKRTDLYNNTNEDGSIIQNVTRKINEIFAPLNVSNDRHNLHTKKSNNTFGWGDIKSLFKKNDGSYHKPSLLSNYDKNKGRYLKNDIHSVFGSDSDVISNPNDKPEDSNNTEDINDIGNYMGLSSSFKLCESTILENIFAVINSAILESAQQPTVIVWSSKADKLNYDEVEVNKILFLSPQNYLNNFGRFFSSLLEIFGWDFYIKWLFAHSDLLDNNLVHTASKLNTNFNKVEQYIYSAENDAILRDLVTANDIQGYIVSLSLNVLCAVIVAAVAMWILYYYVFPWFLTGVRELQLVNTASHRLNHDFRISEGAEWIVMVSTIQWPNFGLLLRWNQRQRRRKMERLCIHIQPIDIHENYLCNLIRSESGYSCANSNGVSSNTASNSDDKSSEIFLYIPAHEATVTTHLGRNQQELFVPMKYSEKCGFEATAPYELISNHKYRLRILRISSTGHIIEQSYWSNEIIPGNKMRFVDLPLMFLRRFLPTRRSSLYLFIDKNTDHYSSFGIPFHFKNIEIIIYDVLGGKRTKRDGELNDDGDNDNGHSNEELKFGVSEKELASDDDINVNEIKNELNMHLSRSLSRALEDEGISRIDKRNIGNNEKVKTFGGLGEKRKQCRYVVTATLITKDTFFLSRRITSTGTTANDERSKINNFLKDPAYHKSFESDKIRIEGIPEKAATYNSNNNGRNKNTKYGGIKHNSSNSNIYILRNSENSSIDSGHHMNQTIQFKSEAENLNSDLYLEQNLISHDRILFELQEADSGQVVAVGDIKCSNLVDIVWDSLKVKNQGNEDDDDQIPDVTGTFKYDLNRGISKSIGSINTNWLDEDIHTEDNIQVYDITTNTTISIYRFVSVAIKLYYVEGGGQWGELSMNLDRSFWVQYMRHDLPAVLDTNNPRSKKMNMNYSGQLETEIGINEKSSPLHNEGNIEMAKVSSNEQTNSSLLSVTKNNQVVTKYIDTSVNSNSTKHIPPLMPEYDKPCFIYDTPGRILINGSDIQVKWHWPNIPNVTKFVPKNVYLHLFDHYTDKYIVSLHGGKPLPNTGTHAWGIEVPFLSHRSSSRDVYLVLTICESDVPSNITVLGKKFIPRIISSNNILNSSSKVIKGTQQIIVAISNAFTIIRVTTLSEFELLYATFCRTFGLEMEVITYDDLQRNGFVVSRQSLRVCENIRKPIPTESHDAVIFCPGQCLISSKVLAVKSSSYSDNIYSAHSNSSNDDEHINGDKSIENCIFFKSRRKMIDVIENCTLNYSTYWWSSSPDRFLLQNGIILDTSILLPVIMKIIHNLRIDSLILFIRTLLTDKYCHLLSKIKNWLLKFRIKIYCWKENNSTYNDTLVNNSNDYHRLNNNIDDNIGNVDYPVLNKYNSIQSLNLSSALLVNSQYSTIYRRRSTWRSSKFNTWKTILNFIKKRRSINSESLNKTRQRWESVFKLVKNTNVKLISKVSKCDKLTKKSENSKYTGTYYNGDEVSCEYTALPEHSNFTDTIPMDESEYIDKFGSKLNHMYKISNILDNHANIMASSFGNTMGKSSGILVPLYIANIKQKQEILHELWYTLQFSTLPIFFNICLYGFQVLVLSIFPITCICLVLIYNYLSSLSIIGPHLSIDPSYASDFVFNPTWNFFMSIPFPIPYLILVSLLYLLIIDITIITSGSSKLTNIRNLNSSSLINKLSYHWRKLLRLFEEIGMLTTIISTFLTLLALSMFLLWFLLGSLINSDNILPYVVMLLALGFVIVSLWTNFSSSRGIVDRFIVENLQSLIAIALGHWFEATNQQFTNNINIIDPNDARAAASEQLHCEIKHYKYAWSKMLLGCGTNNYNLKINNSVAIGNIKNSNIKKSEYLQSNQNKYPYGSLNSCISNEYNRIYGIQWEYLKITPTNSKCLFGVNKNGQIIGVDEAMKQYYGMKLATKNDVINEAEKVDGLLEGFEVALLQDGLKYGPRFGYRVEGHLQCDTWYTSAIVRVPVFPPSEFLSDDIKVHLIFDFFDMDDDGVLNKEEFLYWAKNLHYDRFYYNGPNTSYNEIVKYFNTICHTNVTSSIGFYIEDISLLYSLYPGDLDSDYEKVIPVRYNDDENAGLSTNYGNCGNGKNTDREQDEKLENEDDEDEFDEEFGDIFDDEDEVKYINFSNKSTHYPKGYLWNGILYAPERSNYDDCTTDILNSNVNRLKLWSSNNQGNGYEYENQCDDLNYSSSNKHSKSKYTKHQLLRAINVQKLRYIFTFSTRSLRTPDIETAFHDIHSLAYKVFDAQVALLEPIFGKFNVLFGSTSVIGSNTTDNSRIINNINEVKFVNENDTIKYSKIQTSTISSGIMHRADNNSNNTSPLKSIVSNNNGNSNSPSISNDTFIPSYDNLYGDDNNPARFLQLMRLLHNEIRQDIWHMFNHIVSRLFDRDRVRQGIEHFLDTIHPKLIRRKAARIVNIFYGPMLGELSPQIQDYFISTPPKTAAQVVDALKEYRVDNESNVRDTLEIISLSQGNASIQFQVSLITKALYALSVLKDSDVDMLTVDIPWKRAHTLITEEVLILPRNYQGVKVIIGAIQTVLRKESSIDNNVPIILSDSSNLNGLYESNDINDLSSHFDNSRNLNSGSTYSINVRSSFGSNRSTSSEFTESTLEQVIQVIVSQYLWMDAFILLIRLCGINLSNDRLPCVSYDHFEMSQSNSSYIEERNYEHVQNIFTKLSNGSGFLPVELTDLAILSLTDKCLNFPGLLVSLHFLGLISSEMFSMGTGNPLERLKELGITLNTHVLHIHKGTGLSNSATSTTSLASLSINNCMQNSYHNYRLNINFQSDKSWPLPIEVLSELNQHSSDDNINKMLPEKRTDYGELLDWTLLTNIKGIPGKIVQEYNTLSISRNGFIGRSQLHEYIRLHKKFYVCFLEDPDITSSTTYNSSNVNESSSIVNDQRITKKEVLSIIKENKIDLGTSNINKKSTSSGGSLCNRSLSSNNGAILGGSSQHLDLSKVTGRKNRIKSYKISFDVFDAAITALGFSSHPVQSHILWLLLCLNLKLPNVQPFIDAAYARDFILRIFLQPTYKSDTKYNINNTAGSIISSPTSGNNRNTLGNNIADGDFINHNTSINTVVNKDIGSQIINNKAVNNNQPTNKIQSNSTSFQYQSSIIEPSVKELHYDAQDVCSYHGYFTHEMLCRFLSLAKITLPPYGVHSLWKNLPKDPFDISLFIIPFIEENREDNFKDEYNIIHGNNIDTNNVSILLSNYTTENIGSIHEKNKYSRLQRNFQDNKSLCHSMHLRILMDPTGMDPMEGTVIHIDNLRRLLPRKLMTGLWPEAIKVILNIGLHLEKSDALIKEATSRCLQYSNKYGLIRPGDIVSILAALSKEGLSFDMLCDLLNNMRIQLPVREVKRMFDLMDLNQDKSLDLQELLDGFEVLFGKFLPQLVHEHVGLSYERQGIIMMAASTCLLLFCAFVGIAIKTFEGMRNELSTAVQSVLAIVGAVGLQTGASQDSKEVEERMKQRIEDIMGGDIETSVEQVELNEQIMITNEGRYKYGINSKSEKYGSDYPSRSRNIQSSIILSADKGPILKIGYVVPYKYRSDINDPRPCVTLYSQDNVYLEPIIYCSKGTINQQHNIFLTKNINIRWCIKPNIPKYTGLVFSNENGIINGVIPSFTINKVGCIRRMAVQSNQHIDMNIQNTSNTGIPVYGGVTSSVSYLNSHNNGINMNNNMVLYKRPSISNAYNNSSNSDSNDLHNKTFMKMYSAGKSSLKKLQSNFGKDDLSLLDNFSKNDDIQCDNHGATTRLPLGYHPVQMNRKTFTVYCIIDNYKKIFKSRITFQIIPRTRHNK